jgi:thiol:disulfide interchange protein DsbD
MEKTTFRDPNVIAALDNYLLLKLDMTDNTDEHQQMLKHLKVFGPPTMLFYDAAGQEKTAQRLVGHVSAEGLLAHLSQL